MSQLQALQELYVGDNQLQYSDVEFIIESFTQLTGLGINDLGLTGWFEFRKSRTSTTRLTHILALPQSIGQLASLKSLFLRDNKLTGTIYF
jgi:Leucine-rich repeat (LRR) protein